MLDVLFDENYSLLLLIYQVRDVIWAGREKEIQRAGLSQMERGVLFTIKILESIGTGIATPTEISLWLFRKPNTVTELVKRMEKKGLVKKIKNLDNRKSIRVIMTEKGAALCQETMKSEFLVQMMSVLTKEERTQLWLCLGKLRNIGLQSLGAAKLQYPQFG